MEQETDRQVEASGWRRGLVIAAEVGLILVIVALLAANWVPILFGARQFRVGP